MKYGIREICEVVLRAKGTMAVGNKIFYKGEPVLYFDTLKTSSLEGSSTTVYAQGGRGNARLMSWDGEKTTTFTMEDALISPEGLMILAGAGLINAGDPEQDQDAKAVYQHVTEIIPISKLTPNTGSAVASFTATLSNTPVTPTSTSEDRIYVMMMKDGEIKSEPYIAVGVSGVGNEKKIQVKNLVKTTDRPEKYDVVTTIDMADYDSILVDYYVKHTDPSVMQIEITPDSFGGSFYLEASTLFRNEDGIDVPAEFVIPSCRIQSNFSFSMASSGDPSTFTFTIDCFPDYTRWDPTQKVLAAIQVIPTTGSDEQIRTQTDAGDSLDDIAEG